MSVDKELLNAFDKQIQIYATKNMKKLKFSEGLGEILMALSVVLSTTLISGSRTLGMDQEKFVIFVNDVTDRIKELSIKNYGRDNEKRRDIHTG